MQGLMTHRAILNPSPVHLARKMISLGRQPAPWNAGRRPFVEQGQISMGNVVFFYCFFMRYGL